MKVLVLLLLGWAGASMADTPPPPEPGPRWQVLVQQQGGVAHPGRPWNLTYPHGGPDARFKRLFSHHQAQDHPSCKATVEACHEACNDPSQRDCTDKHTLGGVSVYCCHRPAEHCRASRDDAARHCKVKAAAVHKCYMYTYCCEANQCPVEKQERRRIANHRLDAKRAAEEAKGTFLGGVSSWWNGDGVTEEPPASHPPHAASQSAKKTSGRKLRLVEEGGPTRKSNLKMAVAPPQRPTNHKPSKSSGPGYMQQAYNALDGQLSKIPGLRDGDPGLVVARIERRRH
jgi:hypothetical protein